MSPPRHSRAAARREEATGAERSSPPRALPSLLVAYLGAVLLVGACAGAKTAAATGDGRMDGLGGGDGAHLDGRRADTRSPDGPQGLPCGPGACVGCCVAGSCIGLAEQSPQRCGNGGQTCVECPGGGACSKGSCQGETPCSKASCPTGCCTAGVCLAPAEQTKESCGTSGELCMPCGLHQECQSGTCQTICTDQCTRDLKQCSTQDVQTCKISDKGCTVWEKTGTCVAPQTCTDGECKKTCADQCALEAKQCASDANGVQACGMGSSGCLEWQAPTLCEASQICSGAECKTTCTNQCTKDEKQCTSGGNSVQRCDLVTSGCTEWQPFLACTANQTCVNAACICQPACTGKVCGDDACGGTCGACASYQRCTSGQCELLPTSKWKFSIVKIEKIAQQTPEWDAGETGESGLLPDPVVSLTLCDRTGTTTKVLADTDAPNWSPGTNLDQGEVVLSDVSAEDVLRCNWSLVVTDHDATPPDDEIGRCAALASQWPGVPKYYYLGACGTYVTKLYFRIDPM